MNTVEEIKKIAVIGNIAGGKTKLSKKLGWHHDIPVTHIDTLQFLPGMLIRPHHETKQAIQKIVEENDKWLIDGFGPLDIFEKRLQLADKIVFIDFPLWRHYWWLFKRQCKNIFSPRGELPEGCNELSITHTKKLIKTVWQIHTKMRPELTRILLRENLKSNVIFIKNKKEWNRVYQNGL